jgi:predicted dehydrogenase
VPAGVDYDTWLGPAQALPFNENRFHYNWHWHWNFGTGDMGNDGAHQIDMARWALGVGLPTEAAGLARKVHFEDDQQTPDSMSIAFGYPDARKMLLFEMRIWNPYAMQDIENGLEVYGDAGMLQVAKWDRQWGFKVFDEKGKQVLFEQSPGEDAAHLVNFCDCVRSRKAPNAEIEIGYESVLHCHLGNIVARTGRALRYDAQARAITGDAEATRLLGRDYRKHWATPRV